MKILEASDYADLSRKAADILLAQLRGKPDSLLVLPTGNTPLGLFRELVRAARSGAADFARVRFVTLDEYAGIAGNDRRRLLLWLRKELLDPIGVADDSVLAFDPLADATSEVERIEAGIAEYGGVDLAVVGLGPNGHLGFNEPGSPFDSRARQVPLTPESIRSNAAYWGSEADVPATAFTLGLGTLLASRKLVLIASGAAKRDILARTIDGGISPEVPATLLRRHPDSLAIADRAALGG
ncbi:MAG: glucosamine-6-phosphate deaminase [Bauldia sp.]|uniref:glucosamine-6-phosphate deaminase n=1 Tax=Bauldia sp. TaxID=2575872 RepID=UPI001D1BF7C1|nr:glucosamine-6-phosphate deaminase [Bauldia sp.]MCB1488867.1 glucosamine-6-phosphate deaminase [Bauldia sp.]MCB1495615.1 glucosamine-6-phosphate deaminase [Bauldia sp.]